MDSIVERSPKAKWELETLMVSRWIDPKDVEARASFIWENIELVREKVTPYINPDDLPEFEDSIKALYEAQWKQYSREFEASQISRPQNIWVVESQNREAIQEIVKNQEIEIKWVEKIETTKFQKLLERVYGEDKLAQLYETYRQAVLNDPQISSDIKDKLSDQNYQNLAKDEQAKILIENGFQKFLINLDEFKGQLKSFIEWLVWKSAVENSIDSLQTQVNKLLWNWNWTISKYEILWDGTTKFEFRSEKNWVEIVQKIRIDSDWKIYASSVFSKYQWWIEPREKLIWKIDSLSNVIWKVEQIDISKIEKFDSIDSIMSWVQDQVRDSWLSFDEGPSEIENDVLSLKNESEYIKRASLEMYIPKEEIEKILDWSRITKEKDQEIFNYSDFVLNSLKGWVRPVDIEVFKSPYLQKFFNDSVKIWEFSSTSQILEKLSLTKSIWWEKWIDVYKLRLFNEALMYPDQELVQQKVEEVLGKPLQTIWVQLVMFWWNQYIKENKN